MAKAVKKSTTTFSSLISRRVAKRFSDRQVYFGSITGMIKPINFGLYNMTMVITKRWIGRI